MSARRALRRAARAAVTATICSALAGVGCVAVVSRHVDDRVVGRWVWPPGAARSFPASPVVASPAAAAPGPRALTPPAVLPPTRLRVRAIRVDAALEPLRLDPAGTLTPPRHVDRPGWYADGTLPGDIGPAVIAGHVDSSSGPAVFHRLRELAPGDRIEVVRGDRLIVFTVVGSGWYAKDRFPTARVYGPTPDPQLRLITCGGDFDASRGSYRDNLVVYAVAG